LIKFINMSYSISAAILLVIVAVSSSTLTASTSQNVLARFYSNFAQLYRPTTVKSFVDQEQTMERYQFRFTAKEYLQISDKSLTMLNTNIVERTVTYHPMPNFEVVGSRYFYRRDPKQNYTVEIELVNSEDRLFREVQQPNRYFYLSSFSDLEFSKQIPVMPFYEVTFICNSSFPTDPQAQPPLLSYIDRAFQWRPRYLLDVPSYGAGQQSLLSAYADIYNLGEQTIVIKGAELITGDINLNQRSVEYLHSGFTFKTRSLGEQATGTYVYQLSVPSSITLPARSIKSVQFFETNITVEPFAYYSAPFSTVNSNGNLLNAYNLTSLNTFIPNGLLLLRDQGRFVGQIELPDLSINETYTVVFGAEADVSYRRQVEILEGDENSDSITYHVEYTFENSKLSRDVRVYFVESFSSFRYFQVQNISTSNDKINVPDLVSYGTDLRGYIFLPHQHNQKMISYNLITYKFKPTFNFFEQ